ncbi:universal stress protein [Halovenus rubra]|uniref:Universal stress protein n=2 Tax=Halovenus rubra TaxID=869890 RepID=A0ABD5X4H8_9EURY|nr:universal stress protein [Halovenus rubra]
MYNSILLPTDGSEEMDSVISQAIEIAEIHDATIQAVYVKDTASLSGLPTESTWEGLGKALEAEGQASLDAVATRADTIPVETTVLDGDPPIEIVDYAENNSCDIIIMGTHGRSGAERLLLGSVAERVVRTVSIPVMTIPIEDATRAKQ